MELPPPTDPSVNQNSVCTDINDYLAARGFDLTGSTSVRIIVAIVYSTLFLVGMIGNLAVVVKVARNKRHRPARNMFLVNLTAADFLLCLTAVPFTPVTVIEKRWIFGSAICRLVPLCQSMSVMITSLSLTAIAVDKYIHIVDSTKPPITNSQAAIGIGVIWAVAGFSNLPLVLSYDVVDGAMYIEAYGELFCGEFCDEVHWPKLEYKKLYGTAAMFIQFIIPMIVIIFCYACIMRKVRTDLMIGNEQFSSSLSITQRVKAAKKKRKVNNILITMAAVFIGSWLPLTMFNILRDYNLLPTFISYQPFLWALIVHSTAMTTVVWNPVLFFWLTGRSRKRRRRRQWSTASPVVSSSATTCSTRSTPMLLLRRWTKFIDSTFRPADDWSTAGSPYLERELSSVGMTQAMSSAERSRCPSMEMKNHVVTTLSVPTPKRSRAERVTFL